MCTLFLLVNQIKDVPIAFISNRDEFYNRPTLPLQGFDSSLSKNGNDIYAPLDQAHGGTWFGYQNSIDRKFATLTNIRDPLARKDSIKSRGEIIKNFLQFHSSPRFFIPFLKEVCAEYNGFNLIFGNHTECFYFHSKTKEHKLLWEFSQKKKKIYGLSNGKLDSNWPKVQNTKKKIAAYFKNDKSNSQSIEEHWNFLKTQMQNQHKYEPSLLPHTGVPEELEVFLSSPFVHSETYGTRSTIFFCMEKNKTHIFEQSYDSHSKQIDFNKVVLP